MIEMYLNEIDVTEIGLIPLQGTYNALMKPYTYKKLPENTNSSINGTIVYASPDNRRAEKNTLSLPFHLHASDNVKVTQQRIDLLLDILKQGKEQTGINELYVPDLSATYRLVFDSISSYKVFGEKGAIITIKFTEPNPNNR